MKQPLVSVVIPVYNVEKYLEECFNSVVGQSYENIEIILVDDGSTDTSSEIADRLASSDLRVSVIHKENGGLSDARNVGMRAAKGTYITFLDSDDCMSKDFIYTLTWLAVKNNADITQCDNSRDLSHLGDGAASTIVMSGVSSFLELMKFKIVSPTVWGKLYKKSLFHDNNIEFPVGRLHEDTAVLYKLIYFANTVVF